MKIKMDLGFILLATCILGNFLLVVGRSTPRAVVETLLTDIETAVPIYKHIGSIWEPVSPHKDFYILGQAVRTTVLRPPKDFQLIVGRSVNGSLAEPLDFDHPWTITPGKLIVWRMYCPFGYVSLGDIASKSKKPDVTKYRCVIKDATVPAIRGLVVHSDPNGDHVMRYIGLTAGWRSPFFLIEYLTSHIQTDFYSLRELYTAPTPIPGEETTINTETTTIETSSTQVTGNETKNQNTNQQSNPPTTTILIIFGCLLGFVFILLLTWVAYICARKHKACGYTKGKETGDMALSSGDSARATNGTEYSYAADLHTSDLQDGDYSTIPQVPMDNNVEMRRNVLYEPSTDFQMVPNVIYNGNRPQLVIGPSSNSNEPLMNNSQDNIYAVAT